MDKDNTKNTDSDVEEGEITEDDGVETIKENTLKQVGTNKVLANKNSVLNDKIRSVVELGHRPSVQDFAFGVTGLPSKIGKSILEKAMFQIIGVRRNMVLQFEEYGKTLWIYFRNLETMMLVLKTLLHRKMGKYKLNVEVVQCRHGKLDSHSHAILTQLNFTDKVVVYVHTSSSSVPIVRYRQNQHSKWKDKEAPVKQNEVRSVVQRTRNKSENWDFDPSTRTQDPPSPVKKSIRTSSLQNLPKEKEKQNFYSSYGTHSTYSVTSDARHSPQKLPKKQNFHSSYRTHSTYSVTSDARRSPQNLQKKQNFHSSYRTHSTYSVTSDARRSPQNLQKKKEKQNVHLSSGTHGTYSVRLDERHSPQNLQKKKEKQNVHSSSGTHSTSSLSSDERRTPQNSPKKKEKENVHLSSGTHSTSSLTSDASRSPVSARTPPPSQDDSKPILRDGCTCCDFDYEVYHLVDFLDQTYNQQINLKTTHVLRMLDRIEARLLRTCVNLEQYIHKKQEENNGLFCSVNSFLECPPNQNSTFMCTFEGGKEEESGVYELGFRLRSCRVRRLSQINHNYPDHVVEAAKVIVKMGSSKLWKDVIIYTNRAKKLMLQFFLESDNNEKQESLEYNLIDFFTKGNGKCCDVTSIYIKIPGKLQSKLVMGSAYLEESLSGMKIIHLPTDPLWSDFRAAEMMCKVVEQLMGPTRDTTVLEMGCGNGLIGLYLSKSAGQVLSMDCCPFNIKVAIRNAENIKVKNCEYFDGNTLTVLSRVSNIISHKSVCALVLNRLSPPVADTMMELRKIKDLNKVVLLMEIDTVSKFALPLSVTDNTEELGNPLFITKVVPIDTLPNTKKYLVVILMERINLCDIEKMKFCSGSFKSVKKKHRCFGLGNKCKEVNNCDSTSIGVQQKREIQDRNICEKQEKSCSNGGKLLQANNQRTLLNKKFCTKAKLLLANKQKALAKEKLLMNKQKNLMDEKSCSTGRELFLMIKQNTLIIEKSSGEGELFLLSKQNTIVDDEKSAVEQNECLESGQNISGVETGDEQSCENEETTKLRIMVQDQRKLIAEEQNKFWFEVNQEQKRLLTKEVQKKFQDCSEVTKLKAEVELKKIFFLVGQKLKGLQTDQDIEVFQTEEELNRLKLEEERKQKAKEEQKEIEAWKKRVDAELKKHEEWNRLKMEREQKYFERRRNALNKEWEKKRKRKKTVMPERKRKREEEESECHRNKRENWREHRRDDITYNNKNDDSDSQKILVKQTLEKLMSFINEGGHKESSTRTCLDNTAGPSQEAALAFGDTLDKLKDIMKAVIEKSATMVQDKTGIEQ